MSSLPGLVTGRRCRLVQFRLQLGILRRALRIYRDPLKARRALKALLTKKQEILGRPVNRKIYRAGGRYFWSIATPGWPSAAFDLFADNELKKALPSREGHPRLHTLIFSITSRCPLQCDHCYEWDNLSAGELLSYRELETILRRFQAHGVGSIEFSGGEPLSRYDDLLRLLQSARPDSDLWILTSGFGLTPEKALALKRAGLTGAVISLDHWQEKAHNDYRRNDQSFYWVTRAVKNSARAGLATALSLCARREFVSRENLDKYLTLANDLGAGLIRILEPRQAGHFKGRDIELDAGQIAILRNFYLQTLTDKAYQNLPLVEYTGYHQRRQGCFGAGNRYLYVDSKGDLHACPFCTGAAGSALNASLPDALALLQEKGCSYFSTARG